MSEDIIQIIQNRFYFLISDSAPNKIKNGMYFNTDFNLKYKSFHNDFGPLNLACIHKYAKKIQEIMSKDAWKQKIFIHQTSKDYKKNSNAALLVCSAMIILYAMKSQNIWKSFNKLKLKPFRDAGRGPCTYECTILDCLKGLEYAIKLGWYNYRTFSVEQYQHYDKIQNGYLNWIIPGKFAACSSPTAIENSQKSTKTLKNNQKSGSIQHFVQILKNNKITAIIRLNDQTYDQDKFIQNGIKHYDMIYPDGTNPPDNIVSQFLNVTKNEDVFAVHCAAGLGRTGSLIACFAMKHYFFDAEEFIGWIRLCRPGSIIGPQQHFLVKIQPYMKYQGQQSTIWKQISHRLSNEVVEEKNRKMPAKNVTMNQYQKAVNQKGEIGQGESLLQIKKKISVANE